jgi:hypothetical protein
MMSFAKEKVFTHVATKWVKAGILNSNLPSFGQSLEYLRNNGMRDLRCG